MRGSVWLCRHPPRWRATIVSTGKRDYAPYAGCVPYRREHAIVDANAAKAGTTPDDHVESKPMILRKAVPVTTSSQVPWVRRPAPWPGRGPAGRAPRPARPAGRAGRPP